MKNKIKITLALTVGTLFVLALIPATGVFAADEEYTGVQQEQACDCPECNAEADGAGDDEHEIHDDDCEHDHADDEDDHADHKAHGDDGHEVSGDACEDDCEDDCADEQSIHLDAKAEKLINIRTVKAQTGTIDSTVRLTGQIRLNEDMLAHIAPLTLGIVRKVNKNIGDPVKKDDILAWIESAELGQAKVKYLDIQAELGCCAMLLTRAQTIHDNTLKLIDLLKTQPGLDELAELGELEMGTNRSDLVNAYAEYIFAKSVYEREKPLYEQKISSEQEYRQAENRLKKARADYTAKVDTIRFRVQQDLLEATSTQHRTEIALKGAERTLYVLGQTADDIRGLDVLAINPSGAKAETPPCPDPDCEACRKKAELAATAPTVFADFQRLGWYPLRAPFDGTVIEKHVTMGERLSQDAPAFTVADLDTVWIDMSVFSKDLPLIKKGQTCQITSEIQTLEGRISFLSPVLDPATRTATARVVMDNANGNLRPGLFVTATVSGKADAGILIVPAQAVQTVDGKAVVFVKAGDAYTLRPVAVGRRTPSHVEILSGLKSDEPVVTQGAFDLKAKIVTSTLDSHAGHGH